MGADLAAKEESVYGEQCALEALVGEKLLFLMTGKAGAGMECHNLVGSFCLFLADLPGGFIKRKGVVLYGCRREKSEDTVDHR